MERTSQETLLAYQQAQAETNARLDNEHDSGNVDITSILLTEVVLGLRAISKQLGQTSQPSETDQSFSIGEVSPKALHSMNITTREAATYTGYSIETLRRYTDLGVLPVRRTPGGQRRFTKRDLDRLLEDN